jgi:hypothetical protein
MQGLDVLFGVMWQGPVMQLVERTTISIYGSFFVHLGAGRFKVIKKEMVSVLIERRNQGYCLNRENLKDFGLRPMWSLALSSLME